MKTTLLCFVLAIVAAVAVHGAKDRNVCKVTEGKKLKAFSFDRFNVKLPCKYPAVRGTVCGDWKVVLTPGNEFAYTRRGKNSDVYTRTVWYSLKHIPTNTEWKGRTDLAMAKRYLSGAELYPVVRKKGSIETSSFIFGPRCDDKYISMMTPDGAVKFTLWLWYGFGAWQKESGFKFECNSENFKPTDFPKQLCGNGSDNELNEYRGPHKMNKPMAILYSIFTTEGIAQTNEYCKAAEDTILQNCTTDDDRRSAIKSCWKLAIKGRLRACVNKNGHHPLETFVRCMQYVCAGYPCDADDEEDGLSSQLAEAVDRCESFGDAAQELANCHTDIRMKECSRLKPNKR